MAEVGFAVGKKGYMTDSFYTSLINAIDKRSVGGIASALGLPEQAVSRCLQMSVPSILAGLASKSGDTGALRRIMDLVPSGGDVSWSQIASDVSNPNSPLLSAGKRILSGLFGESQGAVSGAISRECGLQSGTTTTLLSVAAPMVVSFLSSRMRSDGMGLAELGSALQRESPAIRNALPAGLRDVFWPATVTGTTATTPVVAQAVQHERTISRWIPAAIALGAAFLGLFWLVNHFRRPTTAEITPSPTTGTASREATPMRNTASGTLPGNIDLKFNTGSDTLRPKSQEQLHNVLSFLAANPRAHAKIGGYTDNVGGAEQNLRLSQARANSVMDELIHEGVSPNRLAALGYGEQYPVADNSTRQGREQNRRVSVSVSQQ